MDNDVQEPIPTKATINATVSEVTLTPAPNGNATMRRSIVRGLVWVLGGAIAAETAISVACLVFPTQDWSIVNKGVDNLGVVITILASGLLGYLKSDH